MLISPLFLADHPAWRKESGYSQTVSATLYRAYSLLAHASSRTAPWLEIRQVLMKVMVRRMARPQRRNISFLMGLSHASLALYSEALAFFEDACDISVELEDVPAIADITFLCGCLERDQLHLSAATNYFEIALAAFQELTDSTQPENSDKAFNTLIQLAFATFYQAQFDEGTPVVRRGWGSAYHGADRPGLGLDPQPAHDSDPRIPQRCSGQGKYPGYGI